MNERDSRTAMLIGEEALSLLKGSSVAIFGIGGVGSYAVEALARCGVGKLALIDSDSVSESNINRQLIADYSTLGEAKTDAAEKRIRMVNPECSVKKMNLFVTAENLSRIPLAEYDYVIDAIDTVSSKLAIISKCSELGIPVISCMGTGNKLDPMGLKVADIYKTSVCPLARVMRYELRKLGIKKLKVVYSEEEPTLSPNRPEGKAGLGSCSFVPSAMGLILAGEVIKDLLAKRQTP